ncbi:MAG: SMP-30/gluconolactonase/LRE family protein [Balneolaceae bacterium]
MEKRKKLFIKIFLVLLLMIAAAGYIYERVSVLGGFYKAENFFSGTCQPIYGISGPEDIQLDYEKGLAYISGYNRREADKGKDVRGGIYLLDLNEREPAPVELEASYPNDFKPHGFSLYQTKENIQRLFVINRRAGNISTIEIFELAYEKGLKHIETIKSDYLISPNNIAATDDRKFYFTNDGRSRSRFSRTMDTFFKLSTGSIGYFNGNDFALVIKNLDFPNGIAIDTTVNRMYVAETTTGYLKVFQLDHPGKPVYLKKQNIGTGPDNINIDTEGNLWIARQPDLLASNRFMSDPDAKAPSQVLEITPAGDRFEVKLIYSNDGTQISGASSVVFYKNRFLIGTAFGENLLLCDMD